MAKKTSDPYIQTQKLANKSAKQIQKMINKANEATLKFNAEEAKKQREFNKEEATTARQFNADEAQKARDWQTEMSNTAHQREVADLRAAGLNPVLATGSGAQSYTTSSANAQAASGSSASGSVESGASAMASLMSNMMNSLTGLRTTQLNNEASLRAAQISASASRYVADTNYAASKYSADRAYDTQMDKPTTNLIALADKYLGQGTYNLAKSIFDNIFGDNDVTTYKNGKIKTIKAGVAEKFDKIGEKLGITKEMSNYWDYTLNHQNTNNDYISLIWRAIALKDSRAVMQLANLKKAYKNDNHKYKGVQK